ncbi:protein Z-dependent protease inhibitor-like [Cynoglossus semilaevis]|uniref:Serpin peptidase inhibitor, clade A (alpha-1 antiproteinase, antitrypsin), member 10a n=1 Tax=Cynoglossus semilaevis TaxID=244447 RepID=A0A3P8VAZ1_CYNSE|nr:protein Z-dependent protease inhibitor-like [Cynoglossus semilaevis]
MSGSSPFPLLLLLLVSISSSEDLDLVRRNSDFAARLFRSVASRSDDNVFLSPLTLSAALTALASATTGSTHEQLLKGLGLSGLDVSTVTDFFQNLQNSKPAHLLSGLGLFPDQHVQLQSSYVDLVQNKLGATVQKVVYSEPQEAADLINRWAQYQTGDQVKDIVTDLDSQTPLLLASVASYQGRFQPAFNASLTQEERFYVDRYHVVMTSMMFRADKFFLAYDRALKTGLLKLPMTEGAAMLVVFPDADVDVTVVEEQVTSEKIQTWIQQLKKTKLEVQLPRFLLERSYTLKNILMDLEVTQVFQEDADLTNMSGTKGTRLTQVFHKSLLSVDESSDDITAGGGATAFSSPPPRLTINRPFIFIIYQQISGNILGMGRVLDPSRK